MELYCGGNQVEGVREVGHLRGLPKLIILDLTGNPMAAHDDYRLYTIYHLRKLKVPMCTSLYKYVPVCASWARPCRGLVCRISVPETTSPSSAWVSALLPCCVCRSGLQNPSQAKGGGKCVYSRSLALICAPAAVAAQVLRKARYQHPSTFVVQLTSTCTHATEQAVTGSCVPQKPPRDKLVCLHCPMQAVEDEQHFPFYCPLYKHIREQHDFLFGLDHGSIRLFLERHADQCQSVAPTHSPVLSSQDVR